MDEQPFTPGLDPLDGAARDGGLVVDTGELAVGGLEAGDLLALEREVQRAGGAEDCVSLRHSER